MLGMDGLDLNQLTESERDQILSVLGRDDELKRKEQERIRRLRNDVKRLRLKGVIREGQNADRSCARCRQPFGWIFNKGAVCSSCQHRVCDKCRVTRDSATAAVTAPGGGGESWLCVLCHKQMELEAMTNHWFYSKFRKSKRSKKTNQVISGADIIKTSFRRSTRPQYGSTTQAGSSLTEEVKRAIYNNNSSSAAPPQGSPHHGAGPEGSSGGLARGAAYPQEEDKQILRELLGPRGDAPRHVEVRRVTSRRYHDSDDSDSPPSTPPPSRGPTDSLRSSIRSSVRSSAVSSEGRITLVTDVGGVSDMELASVDIPYSQLAAADDPSRRTERYVADPRGYGQPRGPPQGSPSGSTTPVQPVSASSDSDSEYTRETVTKIKFKKMSTKTASRSPSPDDRPAPPGDRPSDRPSSPRAKHDGVAGSVTGGDQETLVNQTQHNEIPLKDPKETPKDPHDMKETPKEPHNEGLDEVDSSMVIIDPAEVERAIRQSVNTVQGEPSKTCGGDGLYPQPSSSSSSSSSSPPSSPVDPIRHKVGALLAKYHHSGPTSTVTATPAATLPGDGYLTVTMASSDWALGSASITTCASTPTCSVSMATTTSPSLLSPSCGDHGNTMTLAALGPAQRFNPFLRDGGTQEDWADRHTDQWEWEHMAAGHHDTRDEALTLLRQDLIAANLPGRPELRDPPPYDAATRAPPPAETPDPPDPASSEYQAYVAEALATMKKTRFGRLFPADDDDDDSLSVISEQTEPSSSTVCDDSDASMHHRTVTVTAVTTSSDAVTYKPYHSASNLPRCVSGDGDHSEPSETESATGDSPTSRPAPHGSTGKPNSRTESSDETDSPRNSTHKRSIAPDLSFELDTNTAETDDEDLDTLMKSNMMYVTDAEMADIFQGSKLTTHSDSLAEEFKQSAQLHNNNNNSLKNTEKIIKVEQSKLSVAHVQSQAPNIKPAPEQYTEKQAQPKVAKNQPSSLVLQKIEEMEKRLNSPSFQRKPPPTIVTTPPKESAVDSSPPPSKPRELVDRSPTSSVRSLKSVFDNDPGYMRVSTSTPKSDGKTPEVPVSESRGLHSEPQELSPVGDRPAPRRALTVSESSEDEEVEEVFGMVNNVLDVYARPVKSPTGDHPPNTDLAIKLDSSHSEAHSKSTSSKSDSSGGVVHSKPSDGVFNTEAEVYARPDKSPHKDQLLNTDIKSDSSKSEVHSKKTSIKSDSSHSEVHTCSSVINEVSDVYARPDKSPKKDQLLNTDVGIKSDSSHNDVHSKSTSDINEAVDSLLTKMDPDIAPAIPPRSFESVYEEIPDDLVDDELRSPPPGHGDPAAVQTSPQDHPGMANPLRNPAVTQPPVTQPPAWEAFVDKWVLIKGTLYPVIKLGPPPPIVYIQRAPDVPIPDPNPRDLHLLQVPIVTGLDGPPQHIDPSSSRVKHAQKLRHGGATLRDSRPESDQNLPSTSAPTIVAPPVSLQKENDARVVEATSSVQSCSDLQGTPSQGEGHTTDPEGHVTITAAAPSVEQDPASVSNGHLAPPSPRAAPSSPTSSPARSSGSRRSQEPSRDTARGADQSPNRAGKRDQSPRGSSPQAASPRRASPHHTVASPHHTGASPHHTGASPLHTGSSPSGSSARDSSPRGTIRDSPRSQKSGKSAASSHEEDNLDELFASHLSVNSHSDSTKRGSNLLSPFSIKKKKDKNHRAVEKSQSLGTSRESILSFYSDAGEVNYGKIPVSGDILLGLDYNYKNNVFEVHVKQCRDLAPVDAKRKRSDPYVKTYLLPDKTKSGKRKTRVKKHTLSPTFDETLRYQITKSELENRALWLTVWHNDSFGRNDFLGEVNIGMDDYMFTNNTPQWYRLMDRPKPLVEEQANPPASLAYKGDLVVSLKFVTSDNLLSKKRARSGERGELHVLVKEARNLTAVRANGSSDPFCKAYLLPEKTKNAKQKTSVKKRDVNPRWNHTFVFEDIARADLPERALELTVWDHDRFTSNDYLGGVRLGTGRGTSGGKEVDWMDSQGEEISLWTSMLDRPNCWIEGTLLLRASMSSRL